MYTPTKKRKYKRVHTIPEQLPVESSRRQGHIAPAVSSGLNHSRNQKMYNRIFKEKKGQTKTITERITKDRTAAGGRGSQQLQQSLFGPRPIIFYCPPKI
jgi:hypothetical protein